MNSFPADTARLIGTFHRRPSIFVLLVLPRMRGIGCRVSVEYPIFKPKRIQLARPGLSIENPLRSALFESLFLQNTQGREGSDHITPMPITSIFQSKLTDDMTFPVLRSPLSRRIPLSPRGITARHDRIRQSTKPIPFNGFGVFCRILQMLIITKYQVPKRIKRNAGIE
jgi:hypothetical protein